MVEHVCIYSKNARGLGENSKRVQVFSWLHNKSAQVIFSFCKRLIQLPLVKINGRRIGEIICFFFSHGTFKCHGCCNPANDNFDVEVI